MMQSKIDHIYSLICKRIVGQELSSTDQEALNTWINASDANRTLYDKLADADKALEGFATYYQIQKAIEKVPVPLALIDQANEGSRIVTLPSRRRRLIMAAASILVVIITGSLYFVLDRKATVSPETPQIAQEVLPAKQRATLKIAGVRSYSLDSVPMGSVVEGAKKTDIGSLQYEGSGGTMNGVIHTVSTPPGGYYNLTLSDGTKVWLNAATDLDFPAKFAGKERKVTLKGEAYFEVAHMGGAPFLVETESGTIRVLGTHFNVKSYTAEAMTTSLLEGSVEVTANTAARRLQPGQQLKITPTTGELKVEAADMESAVGWMKGLFVFDHASLADVLVEIGRWYNVKIVFEKNIDSKSILTGDFDRTLPLHELVKLLEPVAKVKLDIQENKSLVVKPWND